MLEQLNQEGEAWKKEIERDTAKTRWQETEGEFHRMDKRERMVYFEWENGRTEGDWEEFTYVGARGSSVIDQEL